MYPRDACSLIGDDGTLTMRRGYAANLRVNVRMNSDKD